MSVSTKAALFRTSVKGDGSRDVIGQYFSTRFDGQGDITVSNPAQEYTMKYLKGNGLDKFFQGFKGLDDIVNVFFLAYSGLNRSSLVCSNLWVGVMEIRIIMTNAITNLCDAPIFFGTEYAVLRTEELIMFIRPMRVLVAKAVQYLVIFKKHKSESWRFLRKGFLAKLSKDLYNEMHELVEEYKKFQIRALTLHDSDAIAYENHLLRTFKEARKSLLYVQPKSPIGKNDVLFKDVFHKVLDDLDSLKTRLPRPSKGQLGQIAEYFQTPEAEVPLELAAWIKYDFLHLRIHLNIVEDIEYIQKDLLKDEKNWGGIDHQAELNINRANQQLLRELSEPFLEKDNAIWAHQMGLADLGPFGLVELENPEKYLDIKIKENSPFREYSLKEVYTRVDGLDIFRDSGGKISRLDPVPFQAGRYRNNVRKALQIPRKATHVCFFFPMELKDDAKEDSTNTCILHAGDNSPLHIICRFGGFGFFNNAGDLVSVKGVTFGDDIFFDGPYFIPSPDAYSKFEEKDILMSPVTLQPLRELGAIRFGWAANQQDFYSCIQRNDAEVELGPQGREAEQWAAFKGAFFYEYDNTGNESFSCTSYEESGRRNYFQVLDFNELALKRVKNTNTPLMGKMESLIRRYKPMWDDRFNQSSAPPKNLKPKCSPSPCVFQ